MIVQRLPEAFIRDCLESDVDVGVYRQRLLSASREQYDRLRDRALFYADRHATDAPQWLINAANKLIKEMAERPIIYR